MANQFEAFFRTFVVSFGGEAPKESNEGKTADFIFRVHNVIAELKILEKNGIEDHNRKLQELTNEWMRRRQILVYGTHRISLQQLPPPLQLEWLKVLQSPVENIIRDANRQIRATKESAQLPDAKGIVLIMNDGNLLHDSPRDYLNLVARVLQKKTPEGLPRFPHISGIVYFSQRVPMKGQLHPFWAPAYLDTDPKVRQFQDELRKGWYAHLERMTGLPVRGYDINV